LRYKFVTGERPFAAGSLGSKPVLQANPSAGGRVKRGDMYAKLGNHAEARKDYNRVVRGFPGSAKMYLDQTNGRWVRKPESD
jgi:hypothetical protein